MSRRHSKHSPRNVAESSVDIRVGCRSRRDGSRYLNLRLTGHHDDAAALDGLLRRAVLDNPGDPLVIAVSGYQPWFEDILQSCVDKRWSDRQTLHRQAVQYTYTRFPENTSRRHEKQLVLPWAFVVEHVNFPDVYEWSYQDYPRLRKRSTLVVKDYTFRLGVWTCASHAWRHNPNIPVTIIFTAPQPTTTHESDQIITSILFPYLYDEAELDLKFRRSNEEWVACWFLWFFDCLTSWDNIITEMDGYVLEAKERTTQQLFAVDQRTNAIANQIDKIYDLLPLLSMHTRCFENLLLKKPVNPAFEDNGGVGERMYQEDDNRSHTSAIERGIEPIWDDLRDRLNDLVQIKSQLEAMKERFRNLMDLEFNLANAKQTQEAKLLTSVATLFLPISYLASIWGMTTISLSPVQYLYAAIPVFVVSCAVIYIYPKLFRPSKYTPHFDEIRSEEPTDFAMLGNDLPSEGVELSTKNDVIPEKRRRSRRDRREMV